MCSASTSSGSMRPQVDGPDEELLLGGEGPWRVIADSHHGVLVEQAIFIVRGDKGQLPLTVIASAAHCSALPFKRYALPMEWDPLSLAGRSPLCQVPGHSWPSLAGYRMVPLVTALVGTFELAASLSPCNINPQQPH
ncbi:hypothetical protein FKM82_028095 [Ascaphus truei]